MSTGQLNKTLLKNNSRIITGLNNSLYQDDSILLCDTSSAAVSLNLLPIPTDYWNTNQKIYIVDNSNNAATNNITINAPSGFTIDGLSSLTISTNGGGVYLRVLSNTAYISANGSGSGGTGSGHIIQENAVSFTQRPKLNFLNATITDNLGNTSTDVWINGAGVISLTNAAMLGLIAASTVIEGQRYRITDVINCDLGVVVTGTNSKEITLEGNGLFLNADYQGVGDYSAITGALTNLGIWTMSSVPVNINNFCVFNNLNWKNLTGVWGTPNTPPYDSTNWVVLPKTITNGYILESDFVIYDVVTNLVIKRCDSRLNEVEYCLIIGRYIVDSLANFQWGNNRVFLNKVCCSSAMDIINNTNQINNNVLFFSLLNGNAKSMQPDTYDCIDSKIEKNYLLSSEVSFIDFVGVFSYNTIMNYSTVSINPGIEYSSTPFSITKNTINNSIFQLSTLSLNSFIDSNIIENASTVSLSDIQSQFINNTINNGGVTIEHLLHDFYSCTIDFGCVYEIATTIGTSAYKKATKGYSDFEVTLDMSDPTIYDLASKTLTIPTLYRYYIGVFSLNNSNGLIVEKIVGTSTIYPVIFKVLTDAGNATFTAVPIISATLNTIVTTAINWAIIDPLATTELAIIITKQLTNESGYVVVERQGTQNAITEINNFF